MAGIGFCDASSDLTRIVALQSFARQDGRTLSRYSAVNFCSAPTIEFRCWGGGPLADPTEPADTGMTWHRCVAESSALLMLWAHAIAREIANSQATILDRDATSPVVRALYRSQAQAETTSDLVGWLKDAIANCLGNQTLGDFNVRVWDAFPVGERVPPGALWKHLRAFAEDLTPVFDRPLERLNATLVACPIN